MRQSLVLTEVGGLVMRRQWILGLRSVMGVLARMECNADVLVILRRLKCSVHEFHVSFGVLRPRLFLLSMVISRKRKRRRHSSWRESLVDDTRL